MFGILANDNQVAVPVLQPPKPIEQDDAAERDVVAGDGQGAMLAPMNQAEKLALANHAGEAAVNERRADADFNPGPDSLEEDLDDARDLLENEAQDDAGAADAEEEEESVEKKSQQHLDDFNDVNEDRANLPDFQNV